MTLIVKIRSCLIASAYLLAVVTGPAALAIDVEFTSRPVLREILALYDSRHEKKPDVSRLHRLAEMPLNWLGYKLAFMDVNGALPAGDELQRFRGIVTWFSEPLADPKGYLAWLDAATGAGLRLVCLAELAPPEPPGTQEVVSRIFARLGLRFTDQYVKVTHKSKLLTIDNDMAGFERPIDKVLPEFQVLQPASAAAKVHLSASVPDGDGIPSSALIVTSPGGGYVADGFTIYYDEASDRARWVVNPFLFFKLAFGEDRFPVPDVTTLFGRRMYFSHIDGDGWNNISEIEGYREMQAAAADVIRVEAIEPFRDLPVSVGLIGGDAVPELGGLETTHVSARKIFALPHVEVASHTYTHPFAWGFFENYDRQAELALIDQATRPSSSVMDQVRGVLYSIAGKAQNSDTRNRYIAGSASLPRSYLKEPFDIAKEVGGALAMSESFAPPGKKAGIYLWSGDTEPSEATIRATRLAGVRNMNGGDTRLDAEFPSVFYVPPLARPVGAERQIYAANSNENTYTNNWRGPYYGLLMLEQTLNNTESPRRLKPFNLYYHMFSGEKPGALAAIKHFLNLARTSSVIPVKASTYAAVADSFFDTVIQQVDAMSWSVAKRGAVQTFRFDEAGAIDIDVLRSKGVLGATRLNRALYVSLDAVVEPALIVLRKSAGSAESIVSGHPQLIESRWQLSNLKPEGDCSFKIDAQGFGSGEMVWQGAPGKTYELTAQRDGASLASSTAKADAAGRLSVKLEADATEPLELRVVCGDG